MITGPELSYLALEDKHADPTAKNFLPPDWPPNDDFPIVVDSAGNTISRFGDSIWDITIWIGYVFRLNFGDGRRRKDDPGISKKNSRTLKQIFVWWLYRPGRTRSARTLMAWFCTVRPLFVYCSQQKIEITDLYKFPRIIEKLPDILSQSVGHRVLYVLHQIWEGRDDLGFFILDGSALQALANKIPKPQKEQTAYIPPRIWAYQLNRLKACLDDFLLHSEKIENCYNFCLDAYAHNAGSLIEACSNELPARLRPFNANNQRQNTKHPHAIYHGKFSTIASRFGIYDLLRRWLPNVEKGGTASLSEFFNLVSLVGNAYIMNFSLMRLEEVFSLRTNCLTVEHDEDIGEDIYIITGSTTKTINDDDARWITAPSVKVAIDALTTIAKLRIKAATANPDVPVTDTDLESPYLFLRPYEPWRRKSTDIHLGHDIRPHVSSYVATLQKNHLLLDPNELRITNKDLEIALLITPDLDPEAFAVGKVWPLGWHQLRRTGAVNMTGSGIVSDASLQYQLKHATRAMARYYGSGYYHLKLGINQKSTTEFVKTVYEMLANELLMISSQRFVSPHGEKRKQQIVSIIAEKDHNILVRDARAGRISYRPTMLGSCMSAEPCEYGGFEHVARCGGGDGKPPCNDALYDKEKLTKILALSDNIKSRLKTAPPGSPLETSLRMQMQAVENAIYVINL